MKQFTMRTAKNAFLIEANSHKDNSLLDRWCLQTYGANHATLVDSTKVWQAAQLVEALWWLVLVDNLLVKLSRREVLELRSRMQSMTSRQLWLETGMHMTWDRSKLIRLWFPLATSARDRPSCREFNQQLRAPLSQKPRTLWEDSE